MIFISFWNVWQNLPIHLSRPEVLFIWSFWITYSNFWLDMKQFRFSFFLSKLGSLCFSRNLSFHWSCWIFWHKVYDSPVIFLISLVSCRNVIYVILDFDKLVSSLFFICSVLLVVNHFGLNIFKYWMPNKTFLQAYTWHVGHPLSTKS